MGRDEEAPKDGACMCCPHNGDNANVTQKERHATLAPKSRKMIGWEVHTLASTSAVQRLMEWGKIFKRQSTQPQCS